MGNIGFSAEYTIEELQKMLLEPEHYKPVLIFNDKPVHEIRDPTPLPGEYFRVYKEDQLIEVSNYGRIKHKGDLLEQYVRNGELPDYLSVYIPAPGSYEDHVWRFVAKTWYENPDKKEKTIVHHLTNNGFDNRPCNLLWVTDIEHGKIHSFEYNNA